MVFKQAYQRARSMRKQFSQEQYDQDDAAAKKAVCGYLFKRWKYIPLVNKDLYGIDIICYKNGKIAGYVEVERRHSWRGEFTYPTIHVPGRKRKFFENQETTNLIFSVRSDLKKAFWIDGREVLNSPVVFLDNKECDNEDFFDVPIQKWTLVAL